MPNSELILPVANCLNSHPFLAQVVDPTPAEPAHEAVKERGYRDHCIVVLSSTPARRSAAKQKRSAT